MKGKHKVVIKNNRLHYEFEIKRNITIIKGDSATGKTTLINMIRQFTNLGNSSGIELVCDVPCRVLEGIDWQIILHNISGNIIFIDEENAFIKTEQFAKAVRESDNYFVLITRENLYNLPYSVEEIYGIRTSGRYGTLKQSYHEFYRIYGTDTYEDKVSPETIITEDSNSGYQFFEHVCIENGLKCESMNGKSNVFHYLNKHKGEKILVIADGAAFGSEIDRVLQVIHGRKNVALYLPESFEWMIMDADILKNNTVRSILSNPSEYVESKLYFSWERFFTAILIEQTKDTYLAYAKRKLNPAYLSGAIKESILRKMNIIDLNKKDE